MTNADLDSMIVSCVVAEMTKEEIQRGLGGAPFQPPRARKIWDRVDNRMADLRMNYGDYRAVIALNYIHAIPHSYWKWEVL